MRLFIFVLLIGLSTSGKSQKPNEDTITCLPNSKLLKAIKEIENCKVMKEELKATKESVIILESRLENKNLIIKEYESKDSISTQRFINYEKQINNLSNQIKNESFLRQIEVSAYKVKSRVKTGVGVLIGAALVLIIKK